MKSKTKQIERLSKKVKLKLSKIKTTLYTPERKVGEDISGINLTPVSREKVNKKLLTGHVLMGEIAATKKTIQRALHGIVSGKLAKKYRKLNEINDSANGFCVKLLL